MAMGHSGSGLQPVQLMGTWLVPNWSGLKGRQVGASE